VYYLEAQQVLDHQLVATFLLQARLPFEHLFPGVLEFHRYYSR
jgi:hypothetical protein